MVSPYSFQAKFMWAHQHLEALQDQIMDFANSQPCVVVHHFDEESHQHTWRVRGAPLQPPTSIHLHLGDTLYNFRSALDHLAWELVRASGGTPGRNTAFPICERRAQFRSKRVGRRQTAGMLSKIRGAIERLQPYKRSDPIGTNRHLGLLDRLGNIDKHRHFNLVVTSLDLGGFTDRGDDSSVSDWFLHDGPIEDGTVLASAKGHMKVDFHPAFGVAFGKCGEAVGESVREVVLRIELAVEDVFRHLVAPFLASDESGGFAVTG